MPFFFLISHKKFNICWKGECYSVKSFRMKSGIGSLYPVAVSCKPLRMAGPDYIVLVQSDYSTRWEDQFSLGERRMNYSKAPAQRKAEHNK